MTNYVVLNSTEHKNLRVITERSERFGDNLMYAMTFPFEFRNVQSCYPIFFQKDANTGQFFPIALFGFQENENLFLTDQGWNAPYIPLMIKRQPFLIGYQATGEGDDDKKPVVSIDTDNPRISETEGEPLFLEHGANSEYLEGAIKLLESMHKAHEHSTGFIEAMLEHDMLESFSLEIELNDGSKNQLLGLYTINEEKVQQLSGETFGEFNSKGYLMPLFMALASQSRLRTLVDRKNELLV